MEIVVFGAGSLGSLIGGLLARVHDVTLVGRDPHMATIRDRGLQVTGVEEFVVHPHATTDGEGLTAELAVVTVKAYDTAAAARALATGTFAGVLSLQNGMGNETVLASHLNSAILGGTTTVGALSSEAGAVTWTGRGDVRVGGWRRAEPSIVRQTAAAFDDAGLDARVVPDIERVLWEKLAVNAAINPVTALARVKNGALETGAGNAIANEVATETAGVARACGVELTDADATERVATVADRTAENWSSMYQDVAGGTRTEVDAITGYVVDNADAHGVEVPFNRTLAGLVRLWEIGHGLR